MNDPKFNLLKEQFEGPETCAHLGFGIEAVSDAGETERISDITADRAVANDLLDLLRRNRVSILHFRDVVEDYIARVYSIE